MLPVGPAGPMFRQPQAGPILVMVVGVPMVALVILHRGQGGQVS